MDFDVAISGAGPAGLALAAASAQHGLRVVVLERRQLPWDKACGEGLLPAGVAVLERLGARALLSSEEAWPLRAICFIQEDGRVVRAALPGCGGLGIRRLALGRALLRRAEQAGATVRAGVSVTGFATDPTGVDVQTTAGAVRAKLLVAADGLHSPLRRLAGLEVEVRSSKRYGLRRHFAVRPWSDAVEVHLAEGLEAYVTPVGTGAVGVALLIGPRAPGEPPLSYEAGLARFPLLRRFLHGARPISEVMGAGPFRRAARTVRAGRLVLLGDAAGYVDPIAGDGISLALRSAWALAESLPAALQHGPSSASLVGYEQFWRGAFRRYAWTTLGLLTVLRRPIARRLAVRFLAPRPPLAARLMSLALRAPDSPCS